MARAQTQDLFTSGYDPNTKALYISRFAGTGPGTFGTTPTQVLTDSSLSQMRGLTFDARGDLFSTNMNGNGGLGSITEFAAGAAPGTFGVVTTFASGLGQPLDLKTDTRGDLFAATSPTGSRTPPSASSPSTRRRARSVRLRPSRPA